MQNRGPFNVIAGEDLAAYRRVKIESGTTSTPPEVVYADAGEDYIGITQYAVSDGDTLAIIPCNFPGIVEVECTVSSEIARGTVLYGAADGKISDASSGTAQGIAFETGVSGAVISVVAWNVKSTTAGTVSLADAGGLTSSSTVEAVIAEILTAMKTTQATIPVPLGAITMEDGTYLTKQASTTAGFAQLANKELVIDIPVNCASGESLGFSIPVPQDLDDSADVVVHVLAGKDADNDSLTLDCEVYPCAAGDTANDDIQDTAAQAITQAASELAFTCGSAGVLAAPGTLSAVLALGGTNDGDAVYIYGVWIEYTRKVLTS